MKIFQLLFQLLISILLVNAAKKSNICKGKPRDSVFKHPLGCKHYISCKKGVPSTGVCDVGMLFSAINPPCVPEAESECEDATRTTTEATSSLTTTTTPSTRRTSKSSRTTTTKTTTTPTMTTTTTPTMAESTIEDVFSQFFPWLTSTTPPLLPPSTNAVARPEVPTPAPPKPETPTTAPPSIPPPKPPTPPNEISRDVSTSRPTRATTKRKRRRTTTPRTTTVIEQTEVEEIPTESSTTVPTTTSTTSTTSTTPLTTTTLTPNTTTTTESSQSNDSLTPTTEESGSAISEPAINTNSTGLPVIGSFANGTSSETATILEANNIERGIVCPNTDNVTSITFRSSNVDCSRYYICYHGNPMPMNCPAGLHWNGRSGKCEAPESANCTIISNTNATFPVCPHDQIKFFPHPQQCKWFLYCNKGHMTVQQCPYIHLWDFEQEKCLDRDIAKCAIGTEIAANIKRRKT